MKQVGQIFSLGRVTFPGRRGSLSQDGQDRAFDRPTHRLVRRSRGPIETIDEMGCTQIHRVPKRFRQTS